MGHKDNAIGYLAVNYTSITRRPTTRSAASSSSTNIASRRHSHERAEPWPRSTAGLIRGDGAWYLSPSFRYIVAALLMNVSSGCISLARMVAPTP
jgi:hypothetical protein